MKLIDNLFQQIAIEIGSDSCRAVVQPLASNVIYKAHFPDNPITPGVCLIQLVGEVLQQMIGQPVCLKVVDTVKFLHVIAPIDNHPISVAIDSVATDEDALLRVKATISDADTVCTKLSLRYSIS